MPLYDYACASCGAFRAFRPMRESDQPQACPVCAQLSERTLSAPFLAGAGSAGWMGRPRGAGQGRSWRSMCGFGCTHANCAA